MTGEQFRSYRERLELTQEGLAERLGISSRTIQRVEAAGRRQVSTLLGWAIVGLAGHLCK